MNTSKYALTSGNIVTPNTIITRGSLLLENGRIEKILDESSEMPDKDYEVIDCSGKIIMPGFIDVHTHGGIGHEFSTCTTEHISELSQFYYSHGVTTLLATLSPLPHSLLIPAVKSLAEYCAENKDHTNIVGIHLEGPYINKAMSGGNQETYIEMPDYDVWQKVRKEGRGFIRLMTVAPELPGIIPIVEDAIKNGIIISLGHSIANGEVMAQIIEMGATQTTHIFNGMPKLHHREDGILVESLLSDKIDAQLIADGVHVHPKVIQMAVKLKTPDHIMLITDSTPATQVGDGEYMSAGKKVVVMNGVVRAGNGALAGSTLTMERAAKLMNMEVGIDLPAVSRMASLNAARSLGMDKEIGSIEEGKNADIVVLDKAFDVKITIWSGEIKYRK